MPKSPDRRALSAATREFVTRGLQVSRTAARGVSSQRGELAEWSKASHSKCEAPATVPRVRIPHSPTVNPFEMTLFHRVGSNHRPASDQITNHRPHQRSWLLTSSNGATTIHAQPIERIDLSNSSDLTTTRT